MVVKEQYGSKNVIARYNCTHFGLQRSRPSQAEDGREFQRWAKSVIMIDDIDKVFYVFSTGSWHESTKLVPRDQAPFLM